jgi:acyl-CoA synthetase (AMP-forming)/AMP-acid ligase II
VTRFPTVLHTFLESLNANPGATVLEFVEGANACRPVSFEALFHLASRAAAGLSARGMRKGDRIVLALPTCPELIALYLGSLFRGVIPLIEPRRSGGSGRLDAKLVVTPENVAELFDCGEADLLPLQVAPPDIAHLQSTSGSTGRQKLAIVGHGNIVENVAAIGSRLALEPDDKLAIWLPLYHDMGLIAVACTFYWQRPMVLTDPSKFVVHPIRYWLQMISDYRATITAAPNSAYAICARLARRRRFEDLDLTRCRAAFWGAEPIQSETIRAFEEAFAPYGYRCEATLAVYGLAESTLAVTMANVNEPPRVQSLYDANRQRNFDAVGVGLPIDRHRLRIVDADRRELPHGAVGEVEVSGPSIVRGYWEGEDIVTPCAEDDGFLKTGDLGRIIDDNLYVVGRTKDIIIVAGRNFIPSEIETLVETILDNGIVQGVAAFGRGDTNSGTEQVHLLIESRIVPPPDHSGIEETIRTQLADSLGLPGVIIHWTPRSTIPKTTSGKIQRFKCREILATAQS